METIIAAGGLVQNPEGQFLFIFRRGKWDLPKGKVDKEEKIEDAAMREVEEECGIKGLEIIRPISKTYHNYYAGGKKILKETHWFLMKTNWNGELIPQTDEDITKAIWVEKKEIVTLMENTYDTIKKVVGEFIS